MSSILNLAEPLHEQPALLKRFQGEFGGLTKVSTQHIAYVEIEGEVSAEQQDLLHSLLLEGKAEKISHGSHDHAKLYEVSYQAAVMDPQKTAVDKMLKTLDFASQIKAVKMSTVYAFEGLPEEKSEALVHKHLMNKLLNILIPVEEGLKQLTVNSEADSTEIAEGFRELSVPELLQLSEDRSLYMEEHYLVETQRKFRDEYDRDPTDAELEYLAQRTSDHCFHTTWKSLGLFKKLKATVDKVLPNREDIVSVFVDNSGVMAAKGDMTYMVKGETHNSPTAIAPVGGVETMHGGCLRDIIGTGQGGFPTMASQVFMIGSQTKEEMAEDYKVDQFLDPLVILEGMVEGVKNYGNPMGVPNFGGRIFRHPKFFGKPLALGICLGIGKKGYSKIGQAQAGDIALLVGNPTGRDGVHGATMSSAANSEEQVKKEGAAVQIGDPYTERLIMEATPELRPLLRAYGDLGAGGIASCFGEMAEGVGIEMDLEHLPTKYDGLAPWEKLESESQERMGMAVAPENLEKVKEILTAHEVPYFELGKFTGDEKLVVKHGEETIVNLDYEWLENFPVPQKKVDTFIMHPEEVRLDDMNLADAAERILSNPDLADQSRFLNQWDSTVQAKSLREHVAPFTNMPFDQGITVPDPELGCTQVLSLTANPWWSGNPYNMARASFIGSVSKQIAAGVKREKIVMCDNFYTPKSRDEVDFHLTEMVRAITDLMVDLDTPAISGKDSSSGTTKMERTTDGKTESFEIAPIVCMSAMGMGEDAMKVPPKALQTVGNSLFFLPAGISNDASANVLLDEKVRDQQFNYSVDIQEYKKTIDHLAVLIAEGKIKAISVVDDAGCFHRLFEMMLGSGMGVEIDPVKVDEQDTVAGIREQSFLEFFTNATPGSFVVEVESGEVLEGLDSIELGLVIESPQMKVGEEVLELKKMKKTWRKTWFDLLKIPYEEDTISIEKPQQKEPYSPFQSKKKVKIVYYPGINCHQGMIRNWELLGCDVELVSVTQPDAQFADADIVVFPGGFADGDYLGSAKVWHHLMETNFKDQMDLLREGQVPVLGICNGFQLMTRSGFFGENLKLTYNESALFQSRWVKMSITEASSQSIWLKGMEGAELLVPVAHNEGRFMVDGDMTAATVALQYEPNVYPNNPNGSTDGIAGVFSGNRGQFFGGMPHPERAIEPCHYTQDGLLIFENVLKNL